MMDLKTLSLGRTTGNKGGTTITCKRRFLAHSVRGSRQTTESPSRNRITLKIIERTIWSSTEMEIMRGMQFLNTTVG